ncbi:MAG TPA: prepilin-type N-terminal cleavage/methylation domain-containing protein [Alcanivoracaceae bacterium]|nr:prepilin-type N-terminal cleavage/methylation domain-containing protein [Alcanivoracaceae bacterium]
MSYKSSSRMQRSHQTGFTLVEVMVVVVLMTLMAVLLLPNINLGDKNKNESFAVKIEILFAALSEESIFSGELLALKITDDHLQPLRFESYEEGFKPYSQATGSIKPLPVPATLTLRWRAQEELQREDFIADDQVLRDWQESDQAQGTTTTFGEEKITPDVFFYPSGEASAGVLFFYSAQNITKTEFELALSPLGRASLELIE